MKQDITPMHIRSLLESYYDGSCTPAGEAELRDYFATADTVDPDLEADRAIFRAMESHKTADIEAPADLEQRILRATVDKHRHNIFAWLPAIGAAAAVAVLVCAGLKFATLPQPTPAEADSYYTELTDPDEVEAMTLEVFARLDAGLSKARSSIRTTDDALAAVNKTLNKINL